MSIPEQAVSIPHGTWQADVVHWSVGFEVLYMGIATFSGTVKSFQAALADGTLTGSAQIASVVTKDLNLQAQLLSPEFFDAERHPTVSFSCTATRSEGAQVEFGGEITIKGVAQPATLTGTLTGPVADPYGNERYGLPSSRCLLPGRKGSRRERHIGAAAAAVKAERASQEESVRTPVNRCSTDAERRYEAGTHAHI